MSSYTLIRKNRLRDLQLREAGYFDLNFVRAMPAKHRNACMDLLDQSRAQLRQDLFALVCTDFQRDGFFVEFGATNGVDLSNTHLLETQFGWTGILAEPARVYQTNLKANRTCTIETRCVWSKSGETLTFTQAPRGEKSAISRFAKSNYAWRGETYDVTTISLNDLLEEHNAPDTVDFLSIDTEGSEPDILNAFDFNRRQFRVIAVEHNMLPARENLHALLTGHGYRRVLTNISRFDDWYLGPDMPGFPD
ncbi:MAG: FkbM family methyltransferase [Paracoccaceae bacterium]